MSDQPLKLKLTYQGLIQHLAEKAPDATSVRDLPKLSMEHLALVIARWTESCFDALADFADPLPAAIAQTLADTRHTELSRNGQVGCLVIGALRDYLLTLVLRDVQLQNERNRDADAIEAGHDLQPTLTYDQFMAGELGLGRALS